MHQRLRTGVWACVFLLHVLFASFAPLGPAAAHEPATWAPDLCHAGDAPSAPPTHDHAPCPVPACCVQCCATTHGALAPPPEIHRFAPPPVRSSRIVTPASSFIAGRAVLAAQPRGPPAAA